MNSRLLGSGSSGSVHEVTMHVALKVAQPGQEECLRREAARMSQIKHRYIVKPIFETEGEKFFGLALPQAVGSLATFLRYSISTICTSILHHHDCIVCIWRLGTAPQRRYLAVQGGQAVPEDALELSDWTAPEPGQRAHILQ